MAKLGKCVTIKTGKLDANAAIENGKYPFFTCSVTPLRIDDFSYDCECVLVAGNGDLNVKYYYGKFDAYQRTYIIESNDKTLLTVPYLYFFLEKYIETLRKQSFGGIIKYIRLCNLTNAEIPLCGINKQNQITTVLSKLNSVIEMRKKQLLKLDELVKSRFIEMFGDSVYNTNNLPIFKLKTLCKIGSSKRIYQNEQTTSGIPFLRVSDLNNRIDFGIDSCDLFIPIKKYEELDLQGLVPKKGDILVTSRGTIGKCYIVKSQDCFYFQDGMISWLSNIDKRVSSIYLAYLFSTENIQKQIERLQSGSTVAYLSIDMLKKLNIMLPDIEGQNDFEIFFKQADKSKLAIEKSIEKLEILKKSLMQEYFG